MLQAGWIGLGRMGGNMVRRVIDAGTVELFLSDLSTERVAALAKGMASGAGSVAEMLGRFTQGRRIVWLMLPAGEATETTFQEVLGGLGRGDIVIDGANSKFSDTVRRAAQARAKGVAMLDVGVSGGIVAAAHGYPMMIGGPREAFETCRPLFESFGLPGGWGHVGEESGAGHYVKMIHNAIEYGMMQAIAEGFDLLARGAYPGVDLHAVAEIWRHGTVVSGFLMDMTEAALRRDASLTDLAPHVDDSGEGRWAADEALRHAVPFAVNTLALHARFASRDPNSLALRLLAAMRREFGGHAVKTRESPAA